MSSVLFMIGGQTVTVGLALAGVAAALAGLVVGLIWGRGSRGSAAGAPRGAKTRRSPSDDAFMKGLTYLMADHTDQAIEEFTRAVTLNSETVETYVVLGNLFRQKGEIERAVRIRQSIIARPNLERAVRLQALFDLGLDYRKGGLYNRATEAFQEVLSMDPGHTEALSQLVSVYEEIRDWENAFESLKRLDKVTGAGSKRVLAHYKTERGKELMAAGQLDKAEDCFNQAISVDKGCLDAYLHLGDLELARGRHRKAVNIWRKAAKLGPELAQLVVRRMAEAGEDLGEKTVNSFMEEIDTDRAEVGTLMALAEYHHQHGENDRAQELLRKAVAADPQALDAHRLLGQILLARGQKEEALAAFDDLIDQIDGDWSSYQCGQCGFVSPQLTWKCPRCHGWDTMLPRRA